ncbi:hypothetical protein HK104_007536, partial [Borealophlyctis nickersoniae]
VGSISATDVATDIAQAAAAGIDGFALNIGNWPEGYPAEVSLIFSAAQSSTRPFSLFFSFDMGYYTSPGPILDMLKQYANHPNSYRYKGKLFVSTFAGGDQSMGAANVNAAWQGIKDTMAAQGVALYLVPNFVNAGAFQTSFWGGNPVVDGVFSWDAWPYVGEGRIDITNTKDNAVISSAHANGKTYMMPVSPWFFKHLPGANWFRRAGLAWMDRWEQILQSNPDFVEIITWN